MIWAAAACATSGPPQVFRFLSDLSPATAYACLTSTLRQQGFEVSGGDAAERTAVALRRTTATADKAAEWWQITTTVTTAQDGRTQVLSVAGSAAERDGPFGRPAAELGSTVGNLASRCTWPGHQPR